MTHAYAHAHFSNKRVIRELRIVSCPGGGVWVAVTREFECDNCVISEILQSDWTIPNRAGVPRKSTKDLRPSFVRESREGLGPRLPASRSPCPPRLSAESSSSCTSEAPELSTSTSSGSVLSADSDAASVLVNLRAPRLTRKRKIDRNPPQTRHKH